MMTRKACRRGRRPERRFFDKPRALETKTGNVVCGFPIYDGRSRDGIVGIDTKTHRIGECVEREEE